MDEETHFLAGIRGVEPPYPVETAAVVARPCVRDEECENGPPGVDLREGHEMSGVVVHRPENIESRAELAEAMRMSRFTCHHKEDRGGKARCKTVHALIVGAVDFDLQGVVDKAELPCFFAFGKDEPIRREELPEVGWSDASLGGQLDEVLIELGELNGERDALCRSTIEGLQAGRYAGGGLLGARTGFLAGLVNEVFNERGESVEASGEVVVWWS